MSVKKYVYIILVILSIAVKSSLGKKKPADHYFDLCHRNDPKINDCITKTLQKATPKIIAGMPEIGIPVLDPLRIDNVTMVEGSGNFQLYFSMDNVTVKGLTNVELQTFSIDLKNESNTVAKFDVKVPWLHFKGKYIMDGKLLLVPVQGDGDFYLNITQPYLKATLNWHTRINPKNNKKYVRVDSFKWDFVIKGAKVHFYNLFNGNKLLGETVNKFLQDNAVELFSIIKHLPAEAFGALYISVVNDFFNRFTYDELFLP